MIACHPSAATAPLSQLPPASARPAPAQRMQIAQGWHKSPIARVKRHAPLTDCGTVALSVSSIAKRQDPHVSMVFQLRPTTQHGVPVASYSSGPHHRGTPGFNSCWAWQGVRPCGIGLCRQILEYYHCHNDGTALLDDHPLL